MSQSIIQTDGIKRCYMSGRYYGINGEELEKHHIMNGALRDWSEEVGLWVWLTPDWHRYFHESGKGAIVYRRLLKQVAQYRFEEKHGRAEWMRKVGKNYVW